MSETKFTPGPWTIGLTPNGSLELQAGGGWLFRLDDGHKAADEGSDFLETQTANLMLIATAPELYDALQSMLTMFLTTQKLEQYGAGSTPHRAVAALKKARGEQ